MIKIGNKKGLHSRRSALFLMAFLSILFVVMVTDIRYEYLGLTGFAINALSQNTVNIEVDTSNEIGVIRDDFYGANTHGSWLGEGTKIDTDGDGVKESDSDLEWHRQAWLDSGMKMMRWDAYLESNYDGPLENLGFETWTDSSTKYIDEDSETGADGWRVSSYGGGAGYISRSTESYSGDYAMNVTTTESEHLFFYRKVQLDEGKNYNFSAWVKGNGTFSISIQRTDNYEYCGGNSFSLNNSEWKQVSITCLADNSEASSYRAVIDSISENENINIDDVEITENDAPYRPNFTFTGDLKSRIEQLEWARDNNIKILLIASYMPPWLADTSIDGCNSSKLTDCPPYDYNLWGEIIEDYVNKLTLNGIYSDTLMVEIWNEPDINFWLSDLQIDHPLKASSYSLLYGAAFDNLDDIDGISVGGPALTYTTSSNLLNTFFEDHFTEIDFYSYHRYTDNAYTHFTNDTDLIFYYCDLYSSPCNRMIISEWNTYNVSTKNSFLFKSKYGSNIALGYSSILNNWPANVSMILYQWSENEKYSATQYYNEYPQKWNMVSEPDLDNEYTPAYNVTKNFAHFHAGGDTVVTSVSDNTNVRVVSSVKPDGTIYVTVISTASGNVSAVVSFDTNVYGLRNLETGEVYLAEDGGVAIGMLSQYDVKYFVEVFDGTVDEEDVVVVDSGGSGGGGSGGAGSPLTVNSNDSNTSSISVIGGQVIDTNTLSDSNTEADELGYNGNEVDSSLSETESISHSNKGIMGKAISAIGAEGVKGITYLIIILIVIGVLIFCIIATVDIVNSRKEKREKYWALKNWIGNNHSKGYEHEHLKKVLLDNGWNERLVNKAIDEHIDKLDDDKFRVPFGD